MALLPKNFSELMQGLVTVIMLGSAVALVLLEQAVPDWLIALATGSGAYWLGSSMGSKQKTEILAKEKV